VKQLFRLLIAAVAAAVVPSACFAQATAPPQSGYWWNPTDPGSGYVIEVQGNTMLFAGFNYDANGNATWITSNGPMTSATQYAGTLVAYSGGQTLTGEYQAPVQGPPSGNISIEFSADWSALVTLGSGTFAIQRYQFTANGLNSPPAPGEPQTGWWWDPSEGGRGYAVEIQNGLIYFASYMYDTSGNPVWYLASGDVAYATSYQGFWMQYAGGQTLGGPYKAPILANAQVGSVTLQFTDACDMTLTLPNGQQIPLSRYSFASPAVDLSCTVFPIDLAMTNLTANGFQVSESFSGSYLGIPVSGSGSETSNLPYTSSFGNQPALAVAVVATETLIFGDAPSSSSSTDWQYFDASYNPLGEIDDTGTYYVQTSFPGWPSAAKIGDQGPLGSLTIYADQTLSTVTGYQQLSYTVEADPNNAPGAAVLTLITAENDLNPALSSTEYDRFLITEAGGITYLTSELNIQGQGDVLATITSFAPLVTPTAAARSTMSMMPGPSQRHTSSAALARTPQLQQLLLHSLQSRIAHAGK
jgi:hypothetical protein